MHSSVSLFLIVLHVSAFAECIELYCDFREDELGYKCESKGVAITSRNDRTIKNIVGEHLEGKTNEDVKFFRNYKIIMNYFPLNLTTGFKNLEVVQVNFSDLKRITASDLEQFGENLKILWLGDNIVEVIEGDLFKYTPNVESFGLSPQKIKHVDDGTFAKLTKLHSLWFSKNPCGVKTNVENDRSAVLNLITRIESECKDVTLLLKTQVDELREDYVQMRKDLNKLVVAT